MILSDTPSSAAAVSLHTGDTFEAAWEEVLLPWFRISADAAWRKALPTLVVVPYRSFAYYLKSLLLEEELPLLAVDFVTPRELRERIFRALHVGGGIPPREHLHLLLAAVAEDSLVRADDHLAESELLAAKAVANAPEHLLRAIDYLGGAGWDFADAGPPLLQTLAARFFDAVRARGFEFPHHADRMALARAQSRAPVFADVLMAGFTGAHWPFASLLLATLRLAARATAWLMLPRDEAFELDAAWVGNWEQEFGAAQPIGEPRHPRRRPFSRLATRLGMDEDETPAVHFLVGRTTFSQARAVVAMAVHFLADASCERLGILLPGPGALARHVAVLLGEAGIAHFDGVAHLAPGPFEEPGWRAWLALQRAPRLGVLVDFLRALPRAVPWLNGVGAVEIENALRGAYEEVFIDDLAVLRAWCVRAGDERAQRIERGLAALRFLPERARFTEFLRETAVMLEELEWNERWEEIQRLAQGWSEQLPLVFSRETYLRWLDASTSSPRTVRDPRGDHPYSRVHLLAYPQAEGREWSHLILAGLNEGGWPPPYDESGYVREEEVRILNERVRQLNAKALEEGAQGEGHIIVGGGKTLCLGPVEQRQIASRQFANIVESAECGLAASASLHDEAAPGRISNPSDSFTRLYHAAHGKALSQATFEALERRTESWLDSSGAAAAPLRRGAAPDSVEQTRVAYDARHVPGRPAGEYEFCLREPVGREMVLSATDWERALKAPAIVWMRKVLGVRPRDDAEPANLAFGHWVHAWLGRVAGAPGTNCFVQVPAASNILGRISSEAARFHGEVAECLRTFGRVVPDWWVSHWRNAVFVATTLARQLAQVSNWPRMATEWTLDIQSIPLGGGRRLAFSGRIDLLLASGQFIPLLLPVGAPSLPLSDEIAPPDLWVIDYKTGTRRGLTLGGLARGYGLQLVLYALAVSSLGARNVGISLLTRGLKLEAPQLTLSDIDTNDRFWTELHRMQTKGIFGMAGAVRHEFGAGDTYPLATLSVDPDVCEEKWELTHPGFVVAHGEEEE